MPVDGMWRYELLPRDPVSSPPLPTTPGTAHFGTESAEPPLRKPPRPRRAPKVREFSRPEKDR